MRKGRSGAPKTGAANQDPLARWLGARAIDPLNAHFDARPSVPLPLWARAFVRRIDRAAKSQPITAALARELLQEAIKGERVHNVLRFARSMKD